MKKKTVQALCLSLAALMGISSVQVPVMADTTETVAVYEVNKDETSVEVSVPVSENSISENTVSDEKNVEENNSDTEMHSLEELMSLDYTSLSEDEINDFFTNAEDEDVWVFYSSLDDAQKAYVSQFEVFSHSVEVADFNVNEEGEISTDKFERMTYLDYLKSMYGTEKKAYNSSGHCYVGMYFPDTPNDASSTQKLSMSCTGGDTTKSFKVTLALAEPSSWVKTGAYMYYTLNATTKTCSLKDTSDRYSLLYVPLTIHGNKGFSYQMEGSKKVSAGGGTMSLLNKADGTGTGWEKWHASADFAETIYLYINIWKNTTMGNYEGSTDKSVAGRVYLKRMPNSYTMSYHSNGGSGAVGSQVCNYMTTYAYPNSPTPPNYTVTYNANGGNTNSANASVPRTFLGWNTNSAATSGYTGNFVNATPVHGATVVNYAIYGGAAASVSLPSASKSVTVNFNTNGGSCDQPSATANATFNGWGSGPNTGANIGGGGASYAPPGNVTLYAQFTNTSVTAPKASKTGYQLEGWYTAANGGSKVADAGAAFTPNANTTVFAHWSANRYTVKMNENGGSACDDIVAIYDAKFILPEPVRSGYIFKGWQAETALYQAGEVSNLTAENGGVVALTATWEAGETPYTVNRLINDVHDGEYREMTEEEEAAFGVNGKEVLYGTTDSKIPVPAGDISGYETPDLQMVTITADGLAEVTFCYNKVQVPDGFGNSYVDNSVTNNYGSVVDNTDVLKALQSITQLSELNNEQIKAIKTLIASNMAISSEAASKLYDLINSSTGLTEAQKKELLTAIANGYLTDEQKRLLESIVSNSGLSESDRKLLLDSIRSMSNLTMEQQKKILEALESGSYVSYTVDSIEYTIRKNADGTLSVLLKNMNGHKDVVIPNSVTLAGRVYPITEIAKQSFYNNKEIQTLSIGNNVSKIGTSAFEGCTNLKSISFGAGLKEIGAKAFKGCTSLTSISLPKSVVTIGDSAFEGCVKLKTVTLREGLLQIGKKAFYNCSALTKIKIPKSVLKINSYAFAKCKKLKSVSFVADANLTTLSTGVFSNCIALTKIKLPSKVTSIPTKAFYNDKKLKSCTGCAAVTAIGADAFKNCQSLVSMTLPSKVQTVGSRAFYGCKKLGKVSIKSKALTSVGSKAFKNCKKKIRFAVPKEKKAAYTKLLKGKY